MHKHPPLVTIFGGSGFVGRYITRHLAKNGWRIRVAVRHPNEALFVRPYGDVGQVEPIQANIRNEESTRNAIAGADVVINCVGILVQDAHQKFDAVQGEGAGRVARIAAEEGVSKLVHLSAIGADADSDSLYSRSKAAGERAVQDAFPGAVILRPSLIFGREDQFFNRFAAMARLLPVLPVFAAETRFQPVYVDDVARAAIEAVTSDASGVYELGGPDVESFIDLMRRMLVVLRRKRLLLPLPMWMAWAQATVLDMVQGASVGLIPNRIVTRDQLRLLGKDNIVGSDVKTFADLGIVPISMDGVLDDYLYCYRPYGQYEEITSSADSMRP